MNFTPSSEERVLNLFFKLHFLAELECGGCKTQVQNGVYNPRSFSGFVFF